MADPIIAAAAAPSGLSVATVVSLALGSSVLASMITVGAGWIKDWWNTGRDAKYATLHAVLALEAYAQSCSATIDDSTNFESSDGEFGKAWTNVPVFPDLGSVDIKALGIEVAARVLTFKAGVEDTREMLTALVDFDDGQAREMARDKAAYVGLGAVVIARELRKKRRLGHSTLETTNVPRHLVSKHFEAEKR